MGGLDPLFYAMKKPKKVDKKPKNINTPKNQSAGSRENLKRKNLKNKRSGRV